MIKIIGGGRGVGNTFKELLCALEELDKLKIENELLLAQKKDLELENVRLKADKEEMARRDLQIAEEADKLSMAYKEEHEKYKALMLNVEKARKEIEAIATEADFADYNNLSCGEEMSTETARCEAEDISMGVKLDDILEVFDKYLGESEGK